MANAFDKRDKLLKEMGFPTYADYLKSGLWEWIKSELAKTDQDKCYWCHSKVGLVWHHFRYDLATLVGNITFQFKQPMGHGNRECESPPLMRLCTNCHTAAHFENGEFITDLKRVNTRICTRITGPAEAFEEFA